MKKKTKYEVIMEIAIRRAVIVEAYSPVNAENEAFQRAFDFVEDPEIISMEKVTKLN